MEKIHSEIERPEFEKTEKGMLECIKGLASEKGREAAVATYEGRILGLKDPEISFYFAQEYKDYADILAHEQVVIDSKNPFWSVRWVYAFPTCCRLIDHIDIVGESNNPECCYYMALFFRDKDNADTTSYFRQKVYESRSGMWNYMITQAFRGIENIEPHRQAVFSSGNEEYIKKLKFDDEMYIASEKIAGFVKSIQKKDFRK